MGINHCLILAAGFGTRMGSIGQKLPKVLWPVFERPLLELQVAYARSLGAKNIYINLHHMGDSIFDFCKDRSTFEGVKFLWEKPEILDIGGGIHNLASQKEVAYKGTLLVLNADQFFYMKSEVISRYVTALKDAASIIFTHTVNSTLGYNAIEVDAQGLMKNIIQNKEIKSHGPVETYTGIAIVDLSKLELVNGVSKFFDSVCPYKESSVQTVSLRDVDYWDFGTLNRYWESTYKILETYRVNSNHPFLRFLVSERALKTWKIDLQNIAYHSSTPGFINLSSEPMNGPGKAMLLGHAGAGQLKANHVHWSGVSEEVK